MQIKFNIVCIWKDSNIDISYQHLIYYERFVMQKLFNKIYIYR